MLSGLNAKFDGMNDTLNSLSGAVTGLNEQVATLTEQVTDLQNQNDHLAQQNRQLNEKVEGLEQKVGNLETQLDDAEGRARRNNLLFYGIPRTGDSESWQESEDKVKDVIREKLGISDDIQFDRVHRLKGGADSPVIARFTFFKDKDMVLRKKQSLKGSDIFIGEDYTRRVRDVRRRLSAHLKVAKRDKKSAFMVFDHLMIEGKRYDYDPVSDTIRQAP
nr:hypothetical protein BaRGS_010320 [Batillaria attramentaria]